MVYRFTQCMYYDGPDGMGRRARAGDTIGPEDILPGCLKSCLRLGVLVEDVEPEVFVAEYQNEPIPAEQATPEPALPEPEPTAPPIGPAKLPELTTPAVPVKRAKRAK